MDDRPGTKTSEELVATLHRAGVESLLDVRRFPGSHRNPQFNQAALAEDLERAGIAYLLLPDLGGRRSGVPGEDRFVCLRVSSFRSYAAWMSSSELQQAIVQALELASPCFMCAETLPWRCHRRLIGDFLTARKIDVVHLLALHSTIEHRRSPTRRSVAGGSTCAGRPSRKRQRRQPPHVPGHYVVLSGRSPGCA
ncbi:MAG TPA: DUF488 domain-containing protein [Gaiellaceae bacterium]|nr:DUF488 domain-containing protein [Gaiellaceae bacterium]